MLLKPKGSGRGRGGGGMEASEGRLGITGNKAAIVLCKETTNTLQTHPPTHIYTYTHTTNDMFKMLGDL